MKVIKKKAASRQYLFKFFSLIVEVSAKYYQKVLGEGDTVLGVKSVTEKNYCGLWHHFREYINTTAK